MTYISPLPLLGVLLVALKLTKVITWSWLWVLAPFWAGLALAPVIMAVVLFAVVFSALLSGR